jgi:hypothetical protein
VFESALKGRVLAIAAALPPLLVIAYFALINWQPRFASRAAPSEASRSISVEELQKTLVEDRRLLRESEQVQAALRVEVIRLRHAHRDGLIAKEQVVEAERAFVGALTRVHALRHTVTEADIAITEAILGEKVLRLPALPPGGFSETAELTRFNGSFKWSIKETPRIEKYFRQSFGRALPVTALGQSHTHNRLGFDHRDAVDVGLHPDSVEGRQLIDYLRKAGIPFLAFRQAIPGTATGPHIHIGNPSRRLGR